MGNKTYITNNSAQTKKIGRMLAEEILKSKKLKRNAFAVALRGDLGSGKTTFLQGFAKGLGVKEKILSPTFVILKEFKITNHKPRKFYHFDCYRIEKPKEISELGFKEILACVDNIVAIEWPEKINKFLPKNVLVLKFEFLDEKTRKITLKS